MIRHPPRRPFEIKLGRLLCPEQEWRRRADRTIWTVYQVHRLDCEVDLRRAGQRITVRFADLRRDWKWIAHQPRTKETA